MKIYAPSYYLKFNCVKDKCKRTCCKGWEIDVDEDSIKKYKLLDEPLRSRILNNIDFNTSPPSFKLIKDDRCPFLTEDNLCELILKTNSSDILCQICTDHPRFRNFFTDRIEVGLGIACGEACRIILEEKNPMNLIVISDDNKEISLPEDEKYLLEIRDKLFSLVHERNWPDSRYERLMEYFVYRHIADALYDDRLEERIKLLDVYYNDVLLRLSKKPEEVSLEELIEKCVDFSIEVEYKA